MIPGVVAAQRAYAGSGGGGDPHWASVVSLLHFEGTDGSATFADERGLMWSVSGNAKISTAQAKFETSSGLFDGSEDQISASISGFEFSSGDFTIEFWVRFTSVSGVQFIMSTSGSPYIWFEINSGASGKMTAYIHGASRTSLNNISADTWYHVAVSRASGVAKFFIDGVQQGEDRVTTSGPAGSIRWGGASGVAGSSQFLKGHLDEARVTKGVGRYTENFTPPAAPFPSS